MSNRTRPIAPNYEGKLPDFQHLAPKQVRRHSNLLVSLPLRLGEIVVYQVGCSIPGCPIAPAN